MLYELAHRTLIRRKAGGSRENMRGEGVSLIAMADDNIH